MKTKRRSILWWLGTRAFIAQSTVAGVSAGYFALTANTPLVILILFLWLLALVTWNEYRAILNNL